MSNIADENGAYGVAYGVIVRFPTDDADNFGSGSLLVQDVEGGQKLVRSSGDVTGVARDDIIEIDPVSKQYKLLKRGGNVAVAIHLESEIKDIKPALDNILNANGSVDKVTSNCMTLSFALTEGLDAIKKCCDVVVVQVPEAQSWSFVNVYEVDGVTRLEWCR